MQPSLAREEEDGVDCYIEILGAKSHTRYPAKIVPWFGGTLILIKG